MSDRDVCHCECHQPGSTLVHRVACCLACYRCGARVKLKAWNRHVKECAAALSPPEAPPHAR